MLRGTAGGLVTTKARQFTQSQTAGTSEYSDRFGVALAAGRFKSGTANGLAVGAPGEAASGLPFMGVINVLDGSGGSLTSTGARQFTQAHAAGTPADTESFGAALSGNSGFRPIV